MKAKRQTKRPEDINAALAAKKGPVSKFIAQHYRHFNAAALLDTAKGYETHLQAGGKMLVTLAGAMSTAELGISLAEMIRKDKVHAIVCTGANLEHDTALVARITGQKGNRQTLFELSDRRAKTLQFFGGQLFHGLVSAVLLEERARFKLFCLCTLQ